MQSKESNFNLTNSRLRLVSGTTNPKLAEEIASYLVIENVPLISKRFADGELYVQIQQSIRGCDVFLILHSRDKTRHEISNIKLYPYRSRLCEFRKK